MFVVFLFLTLSIAPTDSIRVLFVYGSKPAKAFRDSEPRWFGGRRGGHVGLQTGPDTVVNFQSTKYNPAHFIARAKPVNFRSRFNYRTVEGSWEIFPPHHYNIDSLRRAMFVIPISPAQRRKLDSLLKAFRRQTPYDYAFLGMRCASATYDLLARIGILPTHRHGDWLRVFTTRKLRRILLKAVQPDWKVYYYAGGSSRLWERDRY